MRAREIVLLILIVALGIIFYHAQTGKIFLDWEWGDGIYFGQEEFLYETSETLSPPLPSRLSLINAHGDVEIQGKDQDFILVTFEERIYRRRQKQADEVARDLKMLVQKEGEQIKISTNRESFSRRRFRTNFRLIVPQDLEVEIRNSYGEVRIAEIKTAKIKNAHGDVIAHSIIGPLDVENSYRDVEVEDIQGNCRIRTRNSHVSASRISETFEIVHRYGKVYLSELTQGASVEGSHTEVTAQNIRGHLRLRTSYRTVDLRDVGRVTLRTRNSRVDISGAQGSMDIESSYGKVRLENIKGSTTIRGKNLDIYGNSIIGDRISITTSYRKVELAQFQGHTQIHISHGKAELSPLPLTHPIEVSGRYADIAFLWPGTERFPLEARTKGGEISWKMLGQPIQEESDGFHAIKAFSREEGKPRIALSTTYGTIRIEEGT
ncbi:MAG: hypothetical protein ACE5LV_07005 [Candidatus Aminicenantales bacterium]